MNIIASKRVSSVTVFTAPLIFHIFFSRLPKKKKCYTRDPHDQEERRRCKERFWASKAGERQDSARNAIPGHVRQETSL